MEHPNVNSKLSNLTIIPKVKDISTDSKYYLRIKVWKLIILLLIMIIIIFKIKIKKT